MFKKMLAGIGALSALAIAVPMVGGFEGLRENAYYDTGGVPTICYGETKHVYIGQTIDKTECDRMLNDRLGEFMAYVDYKVIVPMPNTRRAALASFTYNLGKGAFRRSTLLKKLNRGDTVGACNELPKWVCVSVGKGRGDSSGQCARKQKDKRLLRGLVRRREAERKMCLIGAI